MQLLLQTKSTSFYNSKNRSRNPNENRIQLTHWLSLFVTKPNRLMLSVYCMYYKESWIPKNSMSGIPRINTYTYTYTYTLHRWAFVQLAKRSSAPSFTVNIALALMVFEWLYNFCQIGRQNLAKSDLMLIVRISILRLLRNWPDWRESEQNFLVTEPFQLNFIDST